MRTWENSKKHLHYPSLIGRKKPFWGAVFPTFSTLFTVCLQLTRLLSIPLPLLYWREKNHFCPKNIKNIFIFFLNTANPLTNRNKTSVLAGCFWNYVFSNFSSHVWYPLTNPQKNAIFLSVFSKKSENIFYTKKAGAIC